MSATRSQRKKTLICLLDGERSLWDMQRFWFDRAIGILDIFHVSERVWEVANCFHKKESEAAGQFATHHLRMILDGKVGYVLRNLRRLLDRTRNSAPKNEKPSARPSRISRTTKTTCAMTSTWRQVIRS